MMISFLIFLCILAVLFMLYILSLAGRSGYCDFKELKKHTFAHRGLYGNGIPENSLSAFKNAIDNGYGSELDIHLTSDGNLAVIHDASLLRTASVELKIEDLTLKDAKKFPLEGSDETIPSLQEVLELYGGKYPLIIELKPSKNNVEALCKKAYEVLKDYNGSYCIESFDPRCVRCFKKLAPQVVRGQLSQNYFKDKKSSLNPVLKLVMTLLLTNFLTRPDFIAYRFDDRSFISFKLCTKLLGLQGVGWTITDRKEVEKAIFENIIPIFEDK